MKKLLFIFTLILLTSCGTDKTTQNQTTISSQKQTEVSTEPSNEDTLEENMNVIIQKTYNALEEETTLLKIDDIHLEKLTNSGDAFCGNSSAFEVKINKEGAYEAQLFKEDEINPSYCLLIFDADGKLIELSISTKNKETIKKVFTAFELPKIKEFDQEFVDMDTWIDGKYKIDKDYFSYQAYSYGEYDNEGKETDLYPLYHFSYSPNFKMKVDYEIGEGLSEDPLEDYKEL